MADKEEGDTAEDNKRRRPGRTPVTLLVEYEGADELISDFSENLSSAGIFVSTAHEFELGTKVELRPHVAFGRDNANENDRNQKDPEQPHAAHWTRNRRRGSRSVQSAP